MPRTSRHVALIGAAGAVGGVALATAFIAWLRAQADIPNLSMLYLLVVLALASTFGRGSAVLAAILAFLAFNYYFIEPLYTFHVADAQGVLALGVLLVAAMVAGQLAASLRTRAREAEAREQEVRALYELSVILGTEQPLERRLAAAIVRLAQLSAATGSDVLLPNEDDGLEIVATHGVSAAGLPAAEEVAAWAFTHGRPAVPGRYLADRRWIRISDRRAKRGEGADPLGMPMLAGDRRLGVVRLVGCPPGRLADRLHRLQAAVGLLAQAVERDRLGREATEAEILRRADQTKSALLSSVSHDLRTPLASIKAASSNLLDEEVDWDRAAQRELLQAIDEEADRLNRFVSRLLDLSRVEGGTVQPRHEWHDPGEILSDVAERLDPGGERIRVVLAPGLPLAHVDYVMLEQIVVNLLENALKYSPPAEPVEVSTVASDRAFTIAVADRGPGVPPGERERIFDKFYRAPPPAAGIPGTGIGLAIARGLTQALDGRLWVEDNPGGGSRFVLELPRGPRDGPWEAGEREAAATIR